MPWDPPSTVVRRRVRPGANVSTWTTPPSASAPYRSPVAPRTISTRSTAACGTRFQYTQLPNGSLSGRPSASTNVRLAPDPETPRNVTPCVVGLDTRDEERRNRLNPGVLRRASSSAPPAEFRSSAEVMTVVPAAVDRRSAPREAVTTIASTRGAGCSTTRAPSVAPSTVSEATAKPGAVTRIATDPSGASARSNWPSSPVTIEADPAVTVAPGTGAPEESTTTPAIRAASAGAPASKHSKRR